MLTYAIVGFGGLGKSHFSNYPRTYKQTGEAKLVAICDIDESRFVTQTATNLDEGPTDLNLSEFNLYTDVDEMLDKEKIDFVITALPTYLHEQIDVKIMKRGIHVFSEKPMAINLEQAENMLKVAKENNVKLMIGQVCRHEPQYKVLKEAIDSGKYGKVISARFDRHAGTPIWGWQNWYCDEEKSGGCVMDLHCHDTDMVSWLFGTPDYVTSTATHFKTGFDTINTSYVYSDKIVTSRGDWAAPSESYDAFSYSFTVHFEKATIEYRRNNPIYLYEEFTKSILQEPEDTHQLDEERDFMRCILEDRESDILPPESSYETIGIVMAEKESAKKGGEKVYLK